ncbi:hypothetical protein NEFER03_2102 [Nematocida sp. LUAm3]|nr:hypothetical protein NEFER03_2102 [Nematocida sp. LUAm3]KAI5175646.1 hypothetical protein NEFER02_1533 [Nematocida sp. LUAm2]KAI5178552.1 hypothetical protein NEFER01_1688 [Nematocida sp. LUAm1]
MEHIESIEQGVERILEEENKEEALRNLLNSIKREEFSTLVKTIRKKEGKDSLLLVLSRIYVEQLENVEYPNYRRCSLVDKESPNFCSCSFKENTDRTEELDNLLFLSQNIRKDEAKLLLSKITDIAIYSLIPSYLSSSFALISSMDQQSAEAPIRIAEYIHVYNHLGLEYKALKAVEALSKIEKISPSSDRLSLMVMCNYLLKAHNYRGYVNCVERLQSLHMKISPIKSVEKYIKYQKIVTDYDKLIRYKGQRKESQPDFPTVFPNEIPEDLWSWYISSINSSEPLTEEEALKKVSFLRRNKLSYKTEEGILYILQGNSPHSFIDYLEELNPPFTPLLHYHQPTTYAYTPSTSSFASPKEIPSKLPIAVLEKKKRVKSPLRSIFEQREYLLRKSLEFQRALPISEEETSQSILLSIVNNRFKKAQEKNIRTLELVLANEADINLASSIILSAIEEEDRRRREEREQLREQEQQQEQKKEEKEEPSLKWKKEDPSIYTPSFVEQKEKPKWTKEESSSNAFIPLSSTDFRNKSKPKEEPKKKFSWKKE